MVRFSNSVVISSDFDSGNLASVEETGSERKSISEYVLRTAPDCAGSEYENGNRTWFYFSVTTPINFSGKCLRFNIVNLNKQCRLYQQGLTPITKTIPGKKGWERLKDAVEYEVIESGLRLTFQYSITDCRKLTTFFAFCYPFSYTECQHWLVRLDERFTSTLPDGVYYYRELLCRSLEGRRVDLITVTSVDGISEEREAVLPGLFPDHAQPRAHTFVGKKVVVVTCRVHPGETPSSHVFNGLLRFLLRLDDERAMALRRNFVFKLVPMLNPDGVYHGHYRTDTRGVNLNRMYQNPSCELHPSIFAARSLVLYYHNGLVSECTGTESSMQRTSGVSVNEPTIGVSTARLQPREIALYVDLHAHATKRGCFFYGNYFSDEMEQADNMSYPMLVSLNTPHLDFEHCVFSEKNMYASDKRDGLTKEGSGRVALYKATGLVHSYTLECNYNSGRMCNPLTPATLDGSKATPPSSMQTMGHKFSISDYEQVGHALAVALLDKYMLNPWSRLPTTKYKSVSAVQQLLLQRIRYSRAKRSAPSSGKLTEVECVSSSSCSAAPTSRQPPEKAPLLRRQKKIGLTKASARIAVDIARITEERRKAGHIKRSAACKSYLPHTIISERIKPALRSVVFPSAARLTATNDHAEPNKHQVRFVDRTRQQHSARKYKQDVFHTERHNGHQLPARRTLFTQLVHPKNELIGDYCSKRLGGEATHNKTQLSDNDICVSRFVHCRNRKH